MIPFNTHPQFKQSSLVHGWTDGAGPDFKGTPQAPEHARVATALAQALNLPAASWVTQVHGGDVLRVEKEGWAGSADGLWTDNPELGVIGRSADCPIILIGGPKASPMENSRNHAWGFAHASWRSTLAGITSSLVKALSNAGVKPDSMQACICPSAGPCCYEVKNDVVEAAEKSHPQLSKGWFAEREDKIFLNLWQANQDIMAREGLPADQILTTEMCTICNLGFHSYRRDGDAAGRFAAIIGSV